MTAARYCTLLVPLTALLGFSADYSGAEACRSCHPAEFAGQSQSGHARALTHSAADQPGQWAFGAGVQAITFVSRVDHDAYLEHGETWFRAINNYGITPGHPTAAAITYRIFDPAALMLRCFACHSTGPVSIDENDGSIIPHELGIRCEVCHGPGALHAKNPSQNRLRNPAAMPARDLNEFCGQCHRLSVESGREAFDLNDPRNSRNEPLLLDASACFQQTKGGLSCIRCHAPHQAVETKSTFYDAICRKCHAAPRHTRPVASAACVDCHMPGVPFENLSHRNHRIAVYSTDNPVVPINAAKPR